MSLLTLDSSLVVDIVDHVQDNVDEHNVLVYGSLIVDVIDHVLNIVVDVALDDHGVDNDDLVDGLDER